MKMIALKAMRVKVIKSKKKKAKAMKEMKVMMAALEVMEKVTLVMTPQEEKENALMTTIETEYKLETLMATSVMST